MVTQLFVNIGASAIESSLVRSVSDMTPVSFPELVLGDGRFYELYLVDGLGNYASFSGDGSYIPYVAIGQCGYPSGGTMTFTFNGQTTAALAWNITPAALQTALQALSSIGAGNCLVTGVAGEYYLVTFTGTLGGSTQPEITVDTSQLTPASTCDISTIVAGGVGVNCQQLATLAINPISFADNWTTITNGWTGQLSSRTLEMIEAFAAAGGTLSEIFQVTLADADGNRTTYAKVGCSVQCTIINPESFAGADKPLLATQAALNAAVLGLNNFTRQSGTSSGAGNTNITRPASSSRHHLARIAISGAAAARTFSLLTTNSPNAGDVILLVLLPDTTAGNTLSIYNSSTGGTLLSTFTTLGNGSPFFLRFSWSGSAWQLDEDTSAILYKADNLAGLADPIAARANLRTLFSRIVSKSGSFSATSADDGTLFLVATAGGTATATIPAANSVEAGFLLAIQKIDSAAQVVVTSPATRTITDAGETVVLLSDGNAWWVLLVWDPVAQVPSITEVVLNWNWITALTGGGSTDLDGQPTAAGAQPVGSMVLISIGSPLSAQAWELVSGTDASSATVVRPFDFDPTTNPVVWKLILSYTRPTAFHKTTLTAAGTTTLAPATPIHTELLDATGAAAGTYVIVIPTASAVAGDIVKIRANVPATAAVIFDIRNGTAGGTQLFSYSTDGSGTDNGYFELVFDGTNWTRVSNVVPAV